MTVLRRAAGEHRSTNERDHVGGDTDVEGAEEGAAGEHLAGVTDAAEVEGNGEGGACLLYTSPSPRD